MFVICLCSVVHFIYYDYLTKMLFIQNQCVLFEFLIVLKIVGCYLILTIFLLF